MKTDMELRQERDAHRKAARKVNKLLRQRSRKAHGLGPRKKGMGCGLDRDLEAMAARIPPFKDPSSYIRRSDGGEVCKGQDWRDRRVELAERSGGQCEFEVIVGEGFGKNVPGIIGSLFHCDKVATIPAHVIPRYPRRDDRMGNLKHYCGEHDRLTERQSWRRVRSGKLGA